MAKYDELIPPLKFTFYAIGLELNLMEVAAIGQQVDFPVFFWASVGRGEFYETQSRKGSIITLYDKEINELEIFTYGNWLMLLNQESRESFWFIDPLGKAQLKNIIGGIAGVVNLYKELVAISMFPNLEFYELQKEYDKLKIANEALAARNNELLKIQESRSNPQ